MITKQRIGVRALGILLAAVLCGSSPSIAAEPGSGKAGGLVPGSAKSRAGLTREELLREWDLDGDGTISKPEADVARGRMRRQRLDMQLGAGVDPITGLPRSIDTEPEASTDGDHDEPVFRLPPELPSLPAKPRADASPPGMRAPKPASTEPSGSSSVSPSAAAAGASPAKPAAVATTPEKPVLSGRASWLPPQPRSPTVTGGVRAGAPAAVSGYGAGPWSGLNAGRSPTGQPAGGGLVPAPRLPGRTGALILPSLPGTGVPRLPGGTPAPPTPPLPQPSITAEDIGGYRP